MTGNELEVTLLGTGTSTGVPVPGCDCAVCHSPDRRDKRTRCSLLLSHAGRNILIDTATDLRQQALRETIKQIDAVLFTHTHADHVHGIDDLRPFNKAGGEAIPVYAGADVIAGLRRNFTYIFGNGERSGYCPRLSLKQIDTPFELFGLPITPVPLLHGSGSSLGFRIGPVAYLTDCSAIPESSLPLLDDLDLLIIDALRFRPHASHFNIAGALEQAENIGARQTLLTHLTHDVSHKKHSAGLPDSVSFAFDGQRLRYQLSDKN